MLDYEARLWKDGNPDADTYITSRALQEARAGRRFGMKQLMEEARRKDFADTKGARTKINNTLSPALARILIEEHPEIRRFMETRHSVVDEAGI
ncbi:hypothetical protein [uncultured Eggerthella sp.]|nr:hypothetical protein [uncultured Eggerthella sp.]